MNILMVCLGNICRSPIAHGVLENLIKEKGLDWMVDSAGTSSWHNGEMPHNDSILICDSHNINIRNQRSRLFVYEDFNRFDLVVAMDTNNYNNILRMAKNESDRNKLVMLLNYSYPNENRGVPDPYYEGGFDKVYDMINQACLKLVDFHTD